MQYNFIFVPLPLIFMLLHNMECKGSVPSDSPNVAQTIVPSDSPNVAQTILYMQYYLYGFSCDRWKKSITSPPLHFFSNHMHHICMDSYVGCKVRAQDVEHGRCEVWRHASLSIKMISTRIFP
jgi:hypothetical protein